VNWGVASTASRSFMVTSALWSASSSPPGRRRAGDADRVRGHGRTFAATFVKDDEGSGSSVVATCQGWRSSSGCTQPRCRRQVCSAHSTRYPTPTDEAGGGGRSGRTVACLTKVTFCDGRSLKCARR